jgi:glycosyltransferase involved in cell wall biosynthesis
MTGFQSGESLRQLYAHAGMFVLPSSHEGLPIVLLEALSYGVPVLVSDISPNLEVISDPAHIFPMGDVAELGAKISTLAELKLDATVREAAMRACARRYDWDEIAKRTSAAYDELVNAKASPAPSNPAQASTGQTTINLHEFRRVFRPARHRPSQLPTIHE